MPERFRLLPQRDAKEVMTLSDPHARHYASDRRGDCRPLSLFAESISYVLMVGMGELRIETLGKRFAARILIKQANPGLRKPGPGRRGFGFHSRACFAPDQFSLINSVILSMTELNDLNWLLKSKLVACF